MKKKRIKRNVDSVLEMLKIKKILFVAKEIAKLKQENAVLLDWNVITLVMGMVMNKLILLVFTKNVLLRTKNSH